MRLMLFFDGRKAKRALPVVFEYIRPNVKPKKSNSPSGTVQMRVFSSSPSASACHDLEQVMQLPLGGALRHRNHQVIEHR